MIILGTEFSFQFDSPFLQILRICISSARYFKGLLHKYLLDTIVLSIDAYMIFDEVLNDTLHILEKTVGSQTIIMPCIFDLIYHLKYKLNISY